MKKAVALVFVSYILLVSVLTSSAKTQKTGEVRSNKETNTAESSKELQSTLNWLNLLDQAEYTASWSQAARYFQQAVTSEQWLQTITAVRQPLGEIASRSFHSQTRHNTLPGAPDGEYVILTFNSVFANKAQAVETVTAMKAEDGSWKITGYFIK